MGKAENTSEYSTGDNRFETLLRAARTGDEDARSELVENYRDYLLMLANSEMDLNLKSKLGASDVVQQSMLAIHQHIDQFRGNSDSEFKGWIRAIVKNDVANSHRHYRQTQRRKVSREVRIDDSVVHQPAPTDPHRTPQSEAMLKELAVELEKCMQQLSEQHQVVIHMRNWQELSFAEIGAKLDCSADAARKMWFRAFQKLKAILVHSRPELGSHLGEWSSMQLRDGGSASE